MGRRWAPMVAAVAVAIVVGVPACGGGSSDSGSASIATSPGAMGPSTTTSSLDPCRLVTTDEIAAALGGPTVLAGRRDGRWCEYDYASPASLVDLPGISIAIVSGGSDALLDDAIELDEQLGQSTRSLSGLGERAIYQVGRSTLIVLTDRGSVIEVQVIPNDVVSAAEAERQAIAIARTALPRA